MAQIIFGSSSTNGAMTRPGSSTGNGGSTGDDATEVIRTDEPVRKRLGA